MAVHLARRQIITSTLLIAFLLPWNPASAQNLSAEQSLQRITVPPGLRVDLVAAEPLIRQPVAIDWDDRGRLWVMQYLQYPNPAGLERVTVDRYSRTTYDHKPEPPPKGPRGADKLTILTDSDGDGRMDHAKDFIDGLNLASGFAFGHGGVFVLNVPYLLFYPDHNRDDQADSSPMVLLEGFGMQDAHSVANSLTWGPDGWLYGCQGSTVTSTIRGIEFQQGIWRYHPQSKAFELLCEGGGNSWGLDFDSKGQLLYSTNYGGYVLLHGVQGGYYVKSFAKHGALHNPYTYGYFEHAPHTNFTGGHVTVGGLVYQEKLLPDSFQGKYLAADLLGHSAYWHSIERLGSTFRTIHGGSLLAANDPWFAPSDMTVGPDGSIYIADWHDARMAHPDPDAQWDKSNGRIYRLTTMDSPHAYATFDFAHLTDESLINVHRNSAAQQTLIDKLPVSEWTIRRARSELIRRYNHQNSSPSAPTTLIDTLKALTLNSPTESEALQALWSWYSLGAVTDADLLQLIDNPHPAVRRWAVRFIGDQQALGRKVLPLNIAHRLDELAETETMIEVRQQLASTAARLPSQHALPIINANINRDIDIEDPFLPLLWWWAVERHAISGHEEVLKRFVRPTLWKSRLGRDHLLPKLVRRYTAENTALGFNSVIKLLQACPTISDRTSLWKIIDSALPSLTTPLDKAAKESQLNHSEILEARQTLLQMLKADIKQLASDTDLTRLAVRLGDNSLRNEVMRSLISIDANDSAILSKLSVVAAQPDNADVNSIYRIARETMNSSILLATASYLARLDTPETAQQLLSIYQSTNSMEIRQSLLGIILSRRSSAIAWLKLVEDGSIESSAVTADQLRVLADLQDDSINSILRKHWGLLKTSSPEEKLAEVRRLNNDLRAGQGDLQRGAALFKTHCANCHQFKGQGNAIGPDLSSANRQDRDFLLVSIVDPSNVVRKEYVTTAIHSKDGRILTGIAKPTNDGKIMIVNQKGESSLLNRDDIEEMRDSDKSLMPEDLYRAWSPQELRDLFAYIQNDN